jgi:hypothetical protein
MFSKLILYYFYRHLMQIAKSFTIDFFLKILDQEEADPAVCVYNNPLLHIAWLDNHTLTLKRNTAKYYFGEKSIFCIPS